MESSPRDRLRTWVSEQGSRVEVAKRLGCHPSYLTHLLAEGSKRGVGLDLAFAIERETKDWKPGPILASDWVSTEPLAATGTD